MNTAPKCPDCFSPLLLGDVQGYGMTYACRCGYVQPPEAPALSPLGERLMAIRERYIAKGGKLYTREELDAEIAEARLGAKTATQDAPGSELVSERNRGRNRTQKALQDRPSKWGAVRTECCQGHTHDSNAEARRCDLLDTLEKAHVIKDVKRQVPYPLVVNGVKICTYRSDFEYFELTAEDKDGRQVWEYRVEDVKGKATREYVIKRKLMLAVHGITIREVKG